MFVRNPAHLPPLDPVTDPALCALLRAARMSTDCLPTEEDLRPPLASDYDRFLALAAALPACAGHPRAEQIHRALAAVTGLERPLCPHTAHEHWRQFVRLHRHGGECRVDAETPPISPCPLCPPAVPMRLWSHEVHAFPTEIALCATVENATAWTDAVIKMLPATEKPCLLSLPADYVFTRPDLYHVSLALQHPPSERGAGERTLLLTQIIRLLGETLTARGGKLCLRGCTAEAVRPLLSYLKKTDRLPNIVYLSGDPADAAALAGWMAQVETGLVLSADAKEETVQDALAAYARLAPIGRAILLFDGA